MTASHNRIPDHPIESLFLDRWSPRAFTSEEISDADLNSIFEAARWAPSTYNSQPWRFLFARRTSPSWGQFLGLLNEWNQGWAKNAAVIIVAVSKKTFSRPGSDEVQSSRSHSFDTGAAWANLALQATKLGWHAHGIGGFDADRARTELNIPEDYHVEAAITIGRRGDKSILPASFHGGEVPSGRIPVGEFTFEGGFPAAVE